MPTFFDKRWAYHCFANKAKVIVLSAMQWLCCGDEVVHYEGVSRETKGAFDIFIV